MRPDQSPFSSLPASLLALLAPLTLLALLTLLTALGLGGCEQQSAAVTKAAPGPIPATRQRPGDAAAGYDALVNRSVVTCGLPYSAYVASTGNPAPESALPGRRGRNAELPYALTAFTAPSGVELVTSNCLGCHAAPLNGELVIGLGNEFLDFTADPVLAVEAAGAFVDDPAEAAEWQRWADRLGTIAPWAMTDTIGANPAVALTLALMAHRDPASLAWSESPLIAPPPTPVLPVSVPPWWNLGKKHAMFYNGEGRGDHVRYMMLASTTCTDSVAEAAAIDAWFGDVRAYLASLEPPPYPYPIDTGLAATGAAVYRDACATCHGQDGDYPNELIGLEEAGTDPLLAEKGYHEADRFIRWFNRSWYGRGAATRTEPALGYVAPPLDGIWATAPYLHNGSVPTLAALLDRHARPTYWRHADPRPDYDQDALGWRYETLRQGREQFASLDEQKWVYDTTRPGYSNQGHDFGDDLDPAQRRALLEYLKTL